MQLNQAICITLPYSLVVFMVRDFIQQAHGDVDEKQVGSRAGALAGALAFSQVCTSHLWSRVLATLTTGSVFGTAIIILLCASQST